MGPAPAGLAVRAVLDRNCRQIAILNQSDMRSADSLPGVPQLVGTSQPVGASAGMLTGAVPAGASKNIAVNTVSVGPVLTAVCTWPCPGSMKAVPAG
jgi:hypothetical protein